jgi:hypothetical protein
MLLSDTPSAAQMRKYKAHETLYDIIRRSRDEDAVLVVKRIQSGEDIETLVRSIEVGDLLLQLSLRPEWRTRYDYPGRFRQMPPYLDRWPNPYLKTKLFGGSLISSIMDEPNMDLNELKDDDRIYAVPYHTAKLADARLESIDLTKYTTVTNDASLLRSLLEVYLLYEYPFNSFFHADLFFDDIIRDQGPHCSSVLVNAIMAAAWVCSSHSVNNLITGLVSLTSTSTATRPRGNAQTIGDLIISDIFSLLKPSGCSNLNRASLQ